MKSTHPSVTLDPQTLLTAYSRGIFPMGDGLGRVQWYSADPRGIIPLESFHVPRTLRSLVRQQRFEIRINYDFETTMRCCMELRLGATWITDDLIRAYTRLHHLGHAHSVEAWRAGRLVGGLYGVSMGGAYFGESMFHIERDASKVALVHLVQRLKERQFKLLDTQASTPHLRRFGCIEIPAEIYLQKLHEAMAEDCRFD